MASAQEKLNAAIEAWVGDNEDRKAYLQNNPEVIKQFFGDALNNASIYKKAKAAKRAAEGVGLGDYLDKAYTEFRSTPEQVEKSVKKQVEDELKTILGGYGREGMADEEDVSAFREAANAGVSSPSEFIYDWDEAIDRFSNKNIQAAIDRGTAAIERSATARGMNDGSDLRKAIADYAGQKAREDYQNAASLAAQERAQKASEWSQQNQLQQNADRDRLSALQVLAGYGNANVGTQTGLQLDSQRYGFETTENAYQNERARRIAQEEAEKNRKAAQEEQEKQMLTNILTTGAKVAGSVALGKPIV